MYFLNSLLSRLNLLLSGPSRLIGSVINQLRPLNPITPLRQVAGVFRRVPQQLAGPFRPLLKRFGVKVSDGKGEKRSAREDLRDLFRKDGERKARRAVAQISRVSQIHLVGPEDQRYIVHIGSSAARAASQLELFVDGHKVALHFAPSDPPDPRAPIRLNAVSGRADVTVNDAAPALPVTIRSGDTLRINGQPHRVELFHFDRTPVVTRVDASYATNTGPFRENNQDAIAVAQHPKAYLFAVADGVGAGQDGDEVSAFASRYLLTVFFRNVAFELQWIDVLTTAFKHVNAEVRAWVRRSPNPAGTTLTACVVKNWNAYIAHVGDSRLYLFRQNNLVQLTSDHMQHQPIEMATVQAVNLSEPPPLRPVLTRAIGKLDSIEPEVLTVPLTPGDKLLITSDGLTNTVSHSELAALVAGNTPFAAEMLVRRAIELEAKDNVTAVVVECLTEAYVDDIWDTIESDRVFTRPSRSGALKMRKPGEPLTQVTPSPAGCVTFLLIVAIVTIAYWVLTR